jgi:hypothetical protein
MTSTLVPPYHPTPDLKRRVMDAVRTEPAPTPGLVRQRARLVLGICAAIAFGIFFWFGGVRVFDRPTLLVVWTVLGWSAAASAAAWIGVARGRSMVGRTTASLVTLIVATPLVVLGWKIGVTILFAPETMGAWPGRPGFRCLGLSLAMAVPLLVAFVVVRRRSDPLHPGFAGSALGIAAGVFAGTLVDLWCPIAYLPHVLLGHIVPLLVVAAFGAWAGRRFLRL